MHVCNYYVLIKHMMEGQIKNNTKDALLIHNIIELMSCVCGPPMNSRVKSLDVNILLQLRSQGK